MVLAQRMMYSDYRNPLLYSIYTSSKLSNRSSPAHEVACWYASDCVYALKCAVLPDLVTAMYVVIIQSFSSLLVVFLISTFSTLDQTFEQVGEVNIQLLESLPDYWIISYLTGDQHK